MTAATTTQGAGRSKLMGWGLLTPVLAFFLVLNVIPTFWLIGLGFYKYSLGRGTPQWLGIDNFTDIIDSKDLSL